MRQKESFYVHADCGEREREVGKALEWLGGFVNKKTKRDIGNYKKFKEK